VTAHASGVILIGNGGHAKVVLGILTLNGITIAGVVGPGNDAVIEGVPRLGDDDDLPTLRSHADRAFIAVGDNSRREQLFAIAEDLGFELVNAVHRAAVIDPTVRLGRGIAVMAGAIVNPDTVVGDNVVINTGATVDHDCSIDRGAHIGPGSHLSGYVQVGARALIGIGATIGRGRPIKVGEEAVVGAGSVVIEDVAEGAVVWGVPARTHPFRDDSGRSRA
jgi:UDP-perosamine 4-acetyltransferase